MDLNRRINTYKSLFSKHLITVLLILYDAAVVNLSYFLALWIRFDCRFSMIPEMYLNAWERFTLPYTVFCLILFTVLRLYKSLWRFASYSELLRVCIASLITAVVHTAGITLYVTRMPISYYLMGSMLQFLAILGIRFSYRLFRLLYRYYFAGSKREAQGRIMLIGAGDAGQMIQRDINKSDKVKDRVVCFIDDDPGKWNRFLDGTPIIGGRERILDAVDKYQINKIYIALPSARREQRREIIHICKETDCELKILPGMYQLVSGEVSVSNLKAVSIEDLLGREPIRADLDEVYQYIKDKVILVTGGGGSIGSELCRQIATHKPRQLIIFDIYENNAYEIQQELKESHPDLDLKVLIGSVRDSRKMFDLFETYHPQIVYHAAAHKHVPLMEDSPCEAIKNNTIGTYKTAYAAMVHGCERFVLVSTDKAVNPTNIMGASKRLCEMIIQSFDRRIKDGRAADIPQIYTHVGEESADKDGTGNVFRNIRTQFVAVRFGNVLGSNGSVVPLFQKQIAKGGPVTVTHPDIIRYFMTIPEAVSLVLLAGTYADGGQIFVLDMGEPVKIDTLARNLIRLSGLRPDEDIKIEYSGLRPGEKLYEEKLMAEEGLEQTENQLIHIGRPIPFDIEEFFMQLNALMKSAYANKETKLRTLVREMVSTYHPKELHDQE